jgi:hypothetical protein
MHDLVKVVRLGLEKAGVKVHRCRNLHHLKVEWGVALRQSTQPSYPSGTTTRVDKHAMADGVKRFVFDGDRGSVPLLDMLANPMKCKQAYLCEQEAIDVTG